MAFRLNNKTMSPAERIKVVEHAITKSREYLESGKNAQWVGFRALFDRKFRNGKELPLHKDWVKNVFLPRLEKGLRREEKLAEQLEKKQQLRRRI